MTSDFYEQLFAQAALDAAPQLESIRRLAAFTNEPPLQGAKLDELAAEASWDHDAEHYGTAF